MWQSCDITWQLCEYYGNSYLYTGGSAHFTTAHDSHVVSGDTTWESCEHHGNSYLYMYICTYMYKWVLLTLALAYPNLMVIFRTNSFLNRTVWEINREGENITHQGRPKHWNTVSMLRMHVEVDMSRVVHKSMTYKMYGIMHNLCSRKTTQQILTR